MQSTTVKTEARDLDADLAICEAATPGPYRITPCQCGHCDQVFISITRSDGRLCLEDATFYAAAREGWPYAIRRAQIAEQENERLREEVKGLRKQINQQHNSHCYD